MENNFLAFVESKITRHVEFRACELLAVSLNWCRANGANRKFTAKGLAIALSKRGWTKRRTNGGSRWSFDAAPEVVRPVAQAAVEAELDRMIQSGSIV